MLTTTRPKIALPIGPTSHEKKKEGHEGNEGNSKPSSEAIGMKKKGGGWVMLGHAPGRISPNFQP